MEEAKEEEEEKFEDAHDGSANEPLEPEEINQEQIGLLDRHYEQDVQTDSTAGTSIDLSNKYALFEKLLSFLDTQEELNPVLCGYFSKLLHVLVGNKPKEVFEYIANHP
mmetsp:Transcript_34172/g.25241  ORF Transcript_34172/g.25241 Transcript_34172/m.25241 type:complete len:109 (+) Transcript_34172:878-1204(+)